MEIIFRKPVNGKLEIINVGKNDVFDIAKTLIDSNSLTLVRISNRIVALCDEEIMMKDAQYMEKTNFWYDAYYDKNNVIKNLPLPTWIYGSVVFCSLTHTGKFQGLSENDKQFVNDYLYA